MRRWYYRNYNMTTLQQHEPLIARTLRRAVVILAAAGVLALPQFMTNANFLGVPGLPGPMTVLGVGLAFWLLPILLVASWVVEGRIALPHPWLILPAALFVVACIVSTHNAADKMSAMVRAAELSGLWVGAFALAQALRTDAERRLLVAALVAAGLVAAGLGMVQAGWSLPAALKEFQEHRTEFLTQFGFKADSPEEQAFIARFTGGVQASLGHPNVLASFLTLAALAAVGLAREKWAETRVRGSRALAVSMLIVAAVCAAGIVLAQSRAGEVALVVGLYWLGVAWWGPACRLRRAALYAAPLVLAALALAVAERVDHPGIAGVLKTLHFRVDYWMATADVLRESWLRGVGLENFGLHYIEHKRPWAPEEVADPHNLVLSMWSKLGVAGLAALVTLVVVVAVRARRGSGGACTCNEGADTRDLAVAAPSDAARGEPLLDLLAPTIIVGGAAVIGFFMMGSLAAVAAVAILLMVMGLAAAEDPSRLEASGRPLAALRTACFVALAAFVLQELIGTAILEPPTLWAMLVLAAVVVTSRARTCAGGENARDLAAASPSVPIGSVLKFLLMAVAMAAGYVYVAWLLMPVSREWAMLKVAEEVTGAAERDEVLRVAAAANPWSWEPDEMRAREWRAAAGKAETAADAIALEKTMAAYRDALARQPRLRRAYIDMASCTLSMPGALEDKHNLATARGYLESAARLYPTDIQTRVRLADVADRMGESAVALDGYREALRLDDQMPDLSRRLRSEVRQNVERRIGELQQTLAKPAESD